MKKMILASFLLATSAFANDVKISQFSVLRDGGGQIFVDVLPNGTSIQAVIRSCGFKDLSASQQLDTRFNLVGDDETAARAILKGEAVLGAEVPMRDPNLASGTWPQMKVNFSYKNFDGSVKSEIKYIDAPLVIVDGKASEILKNIEDQARTSTGNLCR